MNLGTLQLALWILLGASLARSLPIAFAAPELAAAAVVVGLLAGSAITLLSVCVLGYPTGLALALVAIGMAAFATRRPHRLASCWGWTSFAPSRLDLGLWLIVTASSFGILAPLFSSHMLSERDGTYYSGGGTWGDLGLHLSLISRFAQQEWFTWDLPIYEGAPLTYPFLADFASGMLVRQGWTLQAALIVPGLLLALAFVQLLFFLSLRLFRSAAAAFLAVVLFLLGGSPAGLLYFLRDWRASGETLASFVSHLTKDYTHLIEANLHFANIIGQYLLPQRGTLLGLPAFLLIVILLNRAWGPSTPERDDRRRLLLGAAVLLGLLPFAHVHTFIVVAGVWAWLALASSWRSRRVDAIWWTSLGVALVFAAPQLAWQLSGTLDAEFSRWQLGWMCGPEENLLVFWLRNLGLAVVLLPAALVSLWRRRESHAFVLHLYFPLLALLVVANVYVFQPHAFDNMKFMLYSYLGFALVGGFMVLGWLRSGFLPSLAGAAALASLTGTGVLSILNESRTTAHFVSNEKIRLAREFVAIVPAEARVLTSYLHTHFVPTLTGRRIVMGYRPWLWSYGIDTRKREREVAAMFAGGPDSLRLLLAYGVSFVVIGPSERYSLQPDEAFFSSRFPVVLRSANYVVFDVRKATAIGEAP